MDKDKQSGAQMIHSLIQCVPETRIYHVTSISWLSFAVQVYFPDWQRHLIPALQAVGDAYPSKLAANATYAGCEMDSID